MWLANTGDKHKSPLRPRASSQKQAKLQSVDIARFIELDIGVRIALLTIGSRRDKPLPVGFKVDQTALLATTAGSEKLSDEFAIFPIGQRYEGFGGPRPERSCGHMESSNFC